MWMTEFRRRRRKRTASYSPSIPLCQMIAFRRADLALITVCILSCTINNLEELYFDATSPSYNGRGVIKNRSFSTKNNFGSIIILLAITEPQHQSSSVNRTNNNQQQYPLNASGQLSTSAPHKYSTSIMNDLDQILQFHHSHLSDARKNSNNEGSKKASGTERKNSTNFELSTLSFGNLGSSSSSSSPNSSSCSLESMNRMTIEVNKRNDDERDKPIP